VLRTRATERQVECLRGPLNLVNHGNVHVSSIRDGVDEPDVPQRGLARSGNVAAAASCQSCEGDRQSYETRKTHERYSRKILKSLLTVAPTASGVAIRIPCSQKASSYCECNHARGDDRCGQKASASGKPALAYIL